jgi:TM2 domain-containing membrane protein YozV
MTTSDMPNFAAPGAANPAGVSADTRLRLMFEANKKDACIAYVLWFFVGYFGAHNFYLKRTGIAVAQLILTLTLVGLLIVVFWHLVDAFLIPGAVRRENNRLLTWMLGGVPFPA